MLERSKEEFEKILRDTLEKSINSNSLKISIPSVIAKNELIASLKSPISKNTLFWVLTEMKKQGVDSWIDFKRILTEKLDEKNEIKWRYFITFNHDLNVKNIRYLGLNFAFTSRKELIKNNKEFHEISFDKKTNPMSFKDLGEHVLSLKSTGRNVF